MKWLIFGNKGFIGCQIEAAIQHLWPNDIVCSSDHNNKKLTGTADEKFIRDLYKSEKPDVVVICIGRSFSKDGKGTVDDLEPRRMLPENLQDNLEVPLVLAAVAQQYHFIRKVIYMGTGCIFQLPDIPPAESDLGTFTGSCYSTVKGVTDRLFHLSSLFPKLINVRLRMPVVYEPNPRNLITKLANYQQVIDIPNSMSVLPTLWPVLLKAARESSFSGTLHLVNPGAMTHPDILKLYQTYVDPNHTFDIMTKELQRGLLAAERSNVVLDTKQIEDLAVELHVPLPSLVDAMTEAMKRYAQHHQHHQMVQTHVHDVDAIDEKTQTLALPRHDMYTVMITGGCGFIGSHLIEFLYQQHPCYRIINVDKITYAGYEEHIPANIRADHKRYKLYKEDITNAESMQEIIRNENVRAIFHLAAESSVDVSFQQSLHFTRTNVLGTHTLLQTVQRMMTDRKQPLVFDMFLHISTDEVLGSSYSAAATESQVSDPSNPYSASKTAAEVYVQTYSRYLKVPCMIMRLNNVVGERQFLDKLIPKCLIRRLLGMPLLIHGNGQSRRHFLDARDVARAIDLVFQKGCINEIYHVSESGRDHSVFEIVEWIVQHVKPNKEWQKYWNINANSFDTNASPWQFIENRTFQDHRYVLDGTKMKDMGFQCKYQFEQSLLRTAKWYQQSLKHVSAMVQHDPSTFFRWLEGHYISSTS